MPAERRSPDLVVRTATGDDLDALWRLLAGLAAGPVAGPDPVPETARAAWRRIAAQPGRTVLVADQAGTVAGTLDLLIADNLTHRVRPWAIVENVVVDPARRRSGVGRALMAHAERLARDADCYKIQLMSNERRTGAHAFYAALGYRSTAVAFRRYL